jgi:uncharacterized protein YndB with AHSA1/START domain
VTLSDLAINPALDLVLERMIDVPRPRVWEAWTEPRHLKEWFTPRPWTVAECELDLRPGGKFMTVMRSPEGQLHPGTGCVLEVVPEERLVWTDALLPGWRPAEKPFFTAILLLADAGQGTRYTAVARHRDEAGRKSHEEMGFHQGWGAALDQLVEYTKTMGRG